MNQTASPGRAILVAHVIYRFDVGGLENGLVNLINSLPPTRFRHVVITLAGSSEFQKRIRLEDVPIVSLNKRPGKDPAFYHRFWKLLRDLRPQVVHTRNLGTVDLQVLAALAGVPLRVHGEHGWDIADLQGVNRRNLMIRKLCSNAIHHYVAVSKDLERWLMRHVGIPQSRVSQIYNGVDVDRFVPDGGVLADLPWSGTMPYVIGTVGRLERTKGHALLLDAFHKLQHLCPHSAPRLRLLVAGQGPELEPLQRQAERLGLGSRIWFAGPRNDIPEILRALDLFVLPSFNEGVSNTILEAMACGRAVVAGDVGGNPELVQSDRTGTMFAAGSADSLATAMAKYVNSPDLARCHGGTGRERVVQEFSLDTMTERYAQFYDAQYEARR